ncbi:ABC transporter permease [Halobacillus amylolyticus]|uniref:ABC transporter permease subunit n=1 Tax=Halobacillus amylolyticus TaxID=2932259 RepID=A0ABY4H6Z7_9BACI|nr:ABC transporter permease subunit [Halobacillus amylolyticus]UOR10354.1 ABC transporter permease subunit [Halobacillus amylolyticus]
MKSSKGKLWLLLAPALAFLTLPLYGMFAAVRSSMNGNQGLTFTYYVQLFQSDRFLSSIGFSVRTSLFATIIALIIGLMVTRLFHTYLEKTAPRLSVWLPMLFPHFVWGYLVILLLAETGLITQIFVAVGWIEETGQFPILTRDPYGLGIIITYVWKEIPFVILMLLPIYSSIPSSYYDVVKTLGGRSWEQFRAIEWPHIQPVLIETFLILFSFTLTAYEVPALLGTTFPEMISVLSYQWFYGGSLEERPLAFGAMVFVSIVILTLTLAGYFYINRRRMRAMRGRL